MPEAPHKTLHAALVNAFTSFDELRQFTYLELGDRLTNLPYTNQPRNRLAGYWPVLSAIRKLRLHWGRRP